MSKKLQNGFTLVEVLVSIVIFTVISVGLINVMIVAVKNQNRILQNQKLLDESSYALEYMSKSITMAKLDASGSCTGAINTNFGIGSAPASITFLAYNTPAGSYLCRRFVLATATGTLQEEWSSDATNNFSSPTDITSTKVKVDSLNFALTGDVSGQQPKVTIMMKMEYNSSLENNPDIYVQTSVSQRHLNIVE